MSRVNPIHCRLRRKIRSINKKIAEKEKEKFAIEEKYRGMVGRSKKDDIKRKNDIER